MDCITAVVPFSSSFHSIKLTLYTAHQADLQRDTYDGNTHPKEVKYSSIVVKQCSDQFIWTLQHSPLQSSPVCADESYRIHKITAQRRTNTPSALRITAVGESDLVNCGAYMNSTLNLTRHHSLRLGSNSAVVNKQEAAGDNNLHALYLWWCHGEEAYTQKKPPLPFKETWVTAANGDWSLKFVYVHISGNTQQIRPFMFVWVLCGIMRVHWKMSILIWPHPWQGRCLIRGFVWWFMNFSV